MFGAQPLNHILHRAPTNFVEALVAQGFVKKEDLKGLEGKPDRLIEQTLLARHLCSPEDIAKAYGAFLDIPFIKLIGQNIEPAVLNLIPEGVARNYQVVLYKLEGKVLHLAVGAPASLQARAPESLIDLNRRKGITLALAITTPADINWALSLYRRANPAGGQAGARTGLGVSQTAPVSQVSPIQNRAPSAKLAAVHLEEMKIPHEVLTKFPREVAEKYKVIVFGVEPPVNISPVPKKIKVGILDPANPQVRDILDFIKRRNSIDIEEFQATKEGIAKALEGYGKTATKPFVGEKQAEIKHGLPEPNIAAQKIVNSPPVIKPAPPAIHHDEPVKGAAPPLNQAGEMIHQPKVVMFTGEEVKPPTNQQPEPISTKEQQMSQFMKQVGPIDQTKVDQSKVVPATPNISGEQKIESMKQIAKTVLKPEEKVLKEGIPNPYSVGQNPNNQTPIQPIQQGQKVTATLGSEENIPEVTQNEIKEKEGMVAKETRATDELEESNLDKFLAKPVNSVDDLLRAVKVGLVPEIVASIVSLAVGMEASDVHIEASENNVRLRYRIDGILRDVMKMPLSLHAPLVSRIKILSKMKIDEQRIPQDGRFDVVVREHQIDLRVSTLPTVHGEKVVMRILDKSSGILTLEQLGITGRNFDMLVKSISKPYGIVLATGPTGSGKSTTLYAILQRISVPGVNVITLEDPVEYEIPGINQTQVKPQIGFTFAEGLRSVLRQDPNIIMVGEIRDLETAAMATHAALTGHLVLSTLHTNDAAGALPRLINMGVEPFLITSSINAIVAQRLVRKVCPQCKEKDNLPPALIQDIKEELSKIKDAKIAEVQANELVFYKGKGCSACSNGYHGRMGIYEVLPMSEKIEELAVEKAPASAVLAQALKEGMTTMKQDGLLKALKGITTIDEVLRVTTND